jgi:hypothetical protein
MRVARRVGMNAATAIAKSWLSVFALRQMRVGCDASDGGECLRLATEALVAIPHRRDFRRRAARVCPESDQTILIAQRQVANKNGHRDGGDGGCRPNAEREKRDASNEEGRRPTEPAQRESDVVPDSLYDVPRPLVELGRHAVGAAKPTI